MARPAAFFSLSLSALGLLPSVAAVRHKFDENAWPNASVLQVEKANVMKGPISFAFIFPLTPGDINPSLPVARQLVKEGHKVNFLCFEDFRDAIEDTGAILHDATKYEPALYGPEDGIGGGQGFRKPEMFGPWADLAKDYGLAAAGEYTQRVKLNNVMLELQLPGTLKFLADVNAQVVVYDPVLNREAAFAAQIANIPAIALTPFNGLGAWYNVVQGKLKNRERISADGMDGEAKAFEANKQAIARLNANYSLNIEAGFCYGLIDPIPSLTLVATLEALKDTTEHPKEKDIDNIYKSLNSELIYLGPVIDKTPGALRAGDKKKSALMELSSSADADADIELERVMDEIKDKMAKAKAEGRKIVYASMGTVVSGRKMPAMGWDGKFANIQNLYGRDLCRSSWGGAVEYALSLPEEKRPLVILSLGKTEDPLAGDGLKEKVHKLGEWVYSASFIKQLDVLQQADVFITHGGQNSFLESLTQGVPVVVTPSAGDQLTNADKCKPMGVGLRGFSGEYYGSEPVKTEANPEKLKAVFRTSVKDAVAAILSDPSYKAKAVEFQEKLATGGSPLAVKILHQVASGERALTFPRRQSGVTSAVFMLDEQKVHTHSGSNHFELNFFLLTVLLAFVHV